MSGMNEDVWISPTVTEMQRWWDTRWKDAPVENIIRTLIVEVRRLRSERAERALETLLNDYELFKELEHPLAGDLLVMLRKVAEAFKRDWVMS